MNKRGLINLICLITVIAILFGCSANDPSTTGSSNMAISTATATTGITATANTGGTDTPIPILPPYITVFFWVRTA